MEIFEAFKKLNKLQQDVEKLQDWVVELQFGKGDVKKPVTGQSWVKLEDAIKEVIFDLVDEADALEGKIRGITTGLEVK